VDIQEWLANPDQNFGWILIGNETAIFNARRLHSSEAPDLALRPSLAIQFVSPGGAHGLIIR
jgi:hypothetical protein